MAPAKYLKTREGIVCWSNIAWVPEGPDVYSYQTSLDRAPAKRAVSEQRPHPAPLEP
jgi:hypothetical protein